MREKTRGNSYDIVSLRVSDVGCLVKNPTDKDKERQIFFFLFEFFWHAVLLCALSHENQKQCHVFCLRLTKVLVEVWQWARKYESDTPKKRGWHGHRHSVVSQRWESFSGGDSHPRLALSWKIMPCYISWHIVLLADFQCVEKLYGCYQQRRPSITGRPFSSINWGTWHTVMQCTILSQQCFPVFTLTAIFYNFMPFFLDIVAISKGVLDSNELWCDLNKFERCHLNLGVH